jgi:hypothetical protein
MALPKYELVVADIDNLEIGDIVADKNFYFAMVIGMGRTLIHNHIWIRTGFINCFDEFRKGRKIILHEQKMYKLVSIKEPTKKKVKSKVK